MRFLFVSDFTLEQRSGGAQVSNDLIIKRGRELGHEIIEHDYTSSPVDFLSYYDSIISSNLEVISRSAPIKLDFITKHGNHIRLEHDSCSYLNAEVRRSLFESSNLNFFLSDFHIGFFRERYGNYFENVEIVYDPIDTGLFCDDSSEKIYDVVYCGYLHELKGLKNLLHFASSNPNREISVFGWCDFKPESAFSALDNISFHGERTHEEIAKIFKQSLAVYHSPIVNEPFCRMVGEALLCGVREVIGSTEKIGSYLEFQKHGIEKFSQDCSNAPDVFWQKVQESLK